MYHWLRLHALRQDSLTIWWQFFLPDVFKYTDQYVSECAIPRRRAIRWTKTKGIFGVCKTFEAKWLMCANLQLIRFGGTSHVHVHCVVDVTWTPLRQQCSECGVLDAPMNQVDGRAVITLLLFVPHAKSKINLCDSFVRPCRPIWILHACSLVIECVCACVCAMRCSARLKSCYKINKHHESVAVLFGKYKRKRLAFCISFSLIRLRPQSRICAFN